MAISHIQTMTPEMRRVMRVCINCGGWHQFDTTEVNERTLMELSRRGWVTSTAVQESIHWRVCASARRTQHLVTVGYRVSLTADGTARAKAMEAAG